MYDYLADSIAGSPITPDPSVTSVSTAEPMVSTTSTRHKVNTDAPALDAVSTSNVVSEGEIVGGLEVAGGRQFHAATTTASGPLLTNPTPSSLHGPFITNAIASTVEDPQQNAKELTSDVLDGASSVSNCQELQTKCVGTGAIVNSVNNLIEPNCSLAQPCMLSVSSNCLHCNSEQLTSECFYKEAANIHVSFENSDKVLDAVVAGDNANSLSHSTICPSLNQVADLTSCYDNHNSSVNRQKILSYSSHPTTVTTSDQPAQPESKLLSVQRCMSWSPSMDTTGKQTQQAEESRRKTTDSVPAGLGEHLVEAEGNRANNILSEKLANIFERKHSIPCGHTIESHIESCEHCSAASAANAAIVDALAAESEAANLSFVSTVSDSLTTNESAASSHAGLHSLNSSLNAESLSAAMTASHPVSQLQNNGQINPTYNHAASLNYVLPPSNQHKLQPPTYEGDPVTSVVKIARMVKRVSNGGPVQTPADRNFQVSFCQTLPYSPWL